METIDLIIIIVYLLAIVVVGLIMQESISRYRLLFLGDRKLPWGGIRCIRNGI
ncbi:MAG: hypothetical protein CM15mP44_2660 [Candidatus Neomarinimicrobiota bacterium]|nr:MAG: hypothetical protein CM15mP44_2660 [Candidatus Neomarinimicrobiota bacterium]